MSRIRGGGRRAVVLGAVLPLLAGCGLLPGGERSSSTSSSHSTGDPAEKVIDSHVVRTDLAPLTKRFPALGDPVSARWQSGTFGSERVPGPSLYWIDAVVTLEPATADRLRQAGSPADDGSSPQLVGEMGSELPSGTLTRSDALDDELSHDGWRVRGWLVEGQDVLVIQTQGQ